MQIMQGVILTAAVADSRGRISAVAVRASHLCVYVEVKCRRTSARSQKLNAADAGSRDEGDGPLHETQARSERV